MLNSVNRLLRYRGGGYPASGCSLRATAGQGGVSLIELMVVIVILGVIGMLALPAFQSMMASARTKGTAESILSGLRLARSEAIKRNVPMRFQLVSSLDSACAASTASPLWVVTQTDQVAVGDPDGKCDATPFTPKDDPADQCNAASDPKWPMHPAGNPACADDPFIAAKSPATIPATVQVGADAAIVTFGPLGQVLTNMGGSASMTRVNVSSSTEDVTPWRVLISTGGAIKLCNAGTAIAASNPLKCP
jgi:prepilin-type N-terminal cleavage/methylation domain-containing protein